MLFSWLLLNLITILFLFYSYGFVDLNLTLTSNHFFLHLISFLQHLVYFQRPLSASIYLSLLIGLHLLALLIWWLGRSRFKWSWFWLLPSLILALAYPFLSHDIFNYLFYAKELLFYHQNPHLIPPNHFPHDTWLRFMRWVHVPSPYGYLHTFLVLPSYLLSFGKFTLALFNLKIFNWFAYLTTAFALNRLSLNLKFSPSKRRLVQLSFLFQPLILIEFLINAHNDAWMMAFFLWSLVFFLEDRRFLTLLFFVAAGSIKYITFLSLPFFLLFRFSSFFKLRFSSYQLISWICSSLLIGVVLFWWLFKFQIWYLLWFFTLLPLFLTSFLDFLFSLIYSFYALSYYYFFILTGFWSREPQYYRLGLFSLTFIFLIILNRSTFKSFFLWYNRNHHDR